MVPSGASTPIGNGQSVPTSLLRSNSGMLNGQPPSLPSQTPFSSLVSPRNHYSNMNMLNQSFSNPRNSMDAGAEPDPLSSFGSDPQPDPQGFQMRNMNLTPRAVPVKIEPSHSDQPMYLHQQQQQQQQQQNQHLMQISRQSNMLAQQKLLHLQQQQQQQQHQQQQLFKGMPQQRAQFQPTRSSMKPYEPGMCARRLTHYMFQQQHRPEDNNIEFWRKFVAEYFAPHAKKKWCISMYGSGRQATGVFPQDTWHCEICNRKPGRGFEAAVEVLPRLFKIKYESGTVEELLYIDMPREYQNSSGQIVLDYAKAIQESVFEQLRVVREGQLRIVFSLDLKICSWEFCARRHEELIPRRWLIPQVSQVGAAAQKYTQNSASNLSVQELQNYCNMFVASARNLAKSLEVPLVNELGYTKRYVRCLQISEVVDSMKDLIDYSRETGTGPMESLTKFPRRTASLYQGQLHQAEEPRQMSQEQQHVVNTNASSSSLTTSAIVGMLHQNSMNPGVPANMPAIGDVDNCDSQSSVQKLIHDMLMSNQLTGSGMVGVGSFQNDVKNGSMVGPGLGGGFGVMNGIRSAIGNNSMNGRMMGRDRGLNHHPELGGQLVSGMGPANGFNNFQFDWKPSP